ncbi:hypothetical protein [Pollutibacter soli]|uniref:hypothetical protein n=1 Tax=Pollutibacter soli TaxID=3034157 RepID=UPI0030132645
MEQRFSKDQQTEFAKLLIENEDAVDTAATCDYGISGWFKSYIKSREFAQLTECQKDEAFEAFQWLYYMLNEVHFDLQSA